MNEERAFLDAICADPLDDAPRLIWADWLDGQGQWERAQFVRDQVTVDRRLEAVGWRHQVDREGIPTGERTPTGPMCEGGCHSLACCWPSEANGGKGSWCGYHAALDRVNGTPKTGLLAPWAAELLRPVLDRSSPFWDDPLPWFVASLVLRSAADHTWSSGVAFQFRRGLPGWFRMGWTEWLILESRLRRLVPVEEVALTTAPDDDACIEHGAAVTWREGQPSLWEFASWPGIAFTMPPVSPWQRDYPGEPLPENRRPTEGTDPRQRANPRDITW